MKGEKEDQKDGRAVKKVNQIVKQNTCFASEPHRNRTCNLLIKSQPNTLKLLNKLTVSELPVWLFSIQIKRRAMGYNDSNN